MPDPWDERAERFDRHPVRTGAAGIGAVGFWIFTAIVVVGVITFFLWSFGVFTSGIKGAGDAEVIKNSAMNRIRQQEGFEQLYQDIKVADRNLTLTSIRASTHPNDDKTATEQIGQQIFCNQLVGDYDAKARKFSAEEFRAADLPKEIDETNTQTDCKG